MKKRNLDLLVISDVHLGTFGCRANKLLKYLKSVNPKKIVLNGDIIDGWQFTKYYFPNSHLKVIKYLIKMATTGTKVFYITGNHDEFLRKHSNLKLGNIKILNKLILKINNKKIWFFHGDVFDFFQKGFAKIFAKLGGYGYDLLIVINTLINTFYEFMGKGPLNVSKYVKDNFKHASKYINSFENTISDLAIEKSYDYVVCGHIHEPVIKKIKNKKGEVTYLNSGDWIENLSALEFVNKKWSLFHYNKSHLAKKNIINKSPRKKIKKLLEDEIYEDFIFPTSNR
ncbi:MAG: UDP-2,3-diacylglucosamine diphosphatase [Cytophagales bacterium]